jgi:hypothetical protein
MNAFKSSATASDSRLRPPAPQPITTADSLNASPTTNSSSPIVISTALDDRATASYIRRTLLAHHTALASGQSSGPPKSIHELLPRLTSSDDLDLQLYGMISVLLKEFVNSWYGKITPDHQFMEEMLLVMAHVAREMETRARRVDWEGWIVDEVPGILEGHLNGELESLCLWEHGQRKIKRYQQ